MENLAYVNETTNSDEDTPNVRIAPNRSKHPETESRDVLSGDSLQIYLQQVKRYKLLSRENWISIAR